MRSTQEANEHVCRRLDSNDAWTELLLCGDAVAMAVAAAANVIIITRWVNASD